MWKQKLGISVGNSYSCPTAEVVGIVANAGFDAVSFEWGNNIDMASIVKSAKDNGMILQSLHAPFGNSANMWDTEKDIYFPAVSELLKSAEACAEFEIPIMVVHTWLGFENVSHPSDAGIENFGILVDKAKNLGIKIAFENTEGEEYLFALMDAFKNNDTVGFCWDSGHEMCYNHFQDLLGKFGERLIMTHLNDNLGISRFDGVTYWTDDLHLLPFDGIADWDYNVSRMKNSKIQEILNFELNIISKPNRHENDLYGKMTYEEYFAECYKRACRIAHKYADNHILS